jgi:MFS family permease
MLRTLRHRDFRLLWMGQSVSLIGDGIYLVAIAWQVVALVVVYGIGEALFQPAFSAIVPDVVPRDQLLQANSLRELMEPLGLRFAGPVLGGLLITVFDVGTAFLVDALTFAASAVVVSFMSRQPPPREESHTFRKDLSEGFAYVRDHAWLWAT